MALSVNDAGTWKTVKTLRVNDGGTWKEVRIGWINDSGTWKKFYSGTTTVNVASQNNINLRTLYTNQTGDNSNDAVSVIFNINGNIGSTSTGTASMVTGTWPADSNIIVNVATGVYVVGAGGRGGNSIQGNNVAAAGLAGGTAISLGYSITIVNNGVIGGGGGGGGSLAFRLGGGGAGKNAGAGGTYSYSQGNVTTGNPGTLTAGGTGKGTAPFGGGPPGANGGNLGVSASTLVVNNYPSNGETTYVAGGAAGKAIALNGYTCNFDLTEGGVFYGIIS